MSLITWTPKLSVGIGQIDQQHVKLIEMLNTLYEAVRAGKGNDMISQVMNEMTQYTQYHFGVEERLFKQYQYPKEAEHVKMHNWFKEQVAELQKKLKTNQLSAITETTSLLLNWFTTHISTNDVEYGKFLVSKGYK